MDLVCIHIIRLSACGNRYFVLEFGSEMMLSH
jgi:hypothetical protein